jgi:hypothetical protein
MAGGSEHGEPVCGAKWGEIIALDSHRAMRQVIAVHEAVFAWSREAPAQV